MPHEYTRQRQGRDFSMHDTLMDALAAGRRDDENVQKDENVKKSFAERLEHFKKKAERNAAAVDGDEPPERRGLQK